MDLGLGADVDAAGRLVHDEDAGIGGEPLAQHHLQLRHRRGHRNHLHVRYFSPLAVAAGEKFGGEALAQLGPSAEPTQRVRFAHVIRKGETLARISQRYRVDLTHILKWNGLKRRSTLQVGQSLALYRSVKVAGGRSATSVCHAGPRAVGCWHPSRS